MANDARRRQKLKRLWRRRGLLSLGFLCLIGVAAVRVPIAFERRFCYQEAQAQLDQDWPQVQVPLKHPWLQVGELKLLLGHSLEWLKVRLRLQEHVQERVQIHAVPFDESWSRQQTPQWQTPLLEQARVLRVRNRGLEQARVSRLRLRMIYEFVILGVAAFGGLVLLLLLVLQRDRTGVPLTGHLVLVLPEECVAELAALHQRLRKQQRPRWYVRFRMVQETLELMFGVYIQVNLDNWGLPGQGNRIDDE